MKNVLKFIAGILAAGSLTGSGFGVVASSGCSPAPSSQAPNPAAAECVAHRTAKQLECVDVFTTKLEIDACRDKVKAELDCTKDGGSDG